MTLLHHVITHVAASDEISQQHLSACSADICQDNRSNMLTNIDKGASYRNLAAQITICHP